MTSLAVMRHAPTAWNHAKRLQGRADIVIDDDARDELQHLALPAAFVGWRVVASPLARARETARLLTGSDPAIDARLIEMDWGGYEGQSVADLRVQGGAAFIAEEAKGLDFTPPNGESPRQVMARLRPWLAELAARRENTFAVTHKGVMRALLALATGWDMLGKAPVKFRWPALHQFEIGNDGAVRLKNANIALDRR